MNWLWNVLFGDEQFLISDCDCDGNSILDREEIIFDWTSDKTVK